MKFRIFVSIIGAGALLAGSYGVYRYFVSLKKLPAKLVVAAPRRQVRVRQVVYRSIPTTITGYGRVVAAQPVDFIAEVPGKIVRGDVALKVGQSFGAGALLFGIDAREAQLALTAQRSNYIKLIAGILPDLKMDYRESYPTWLAYFGALDAEKNLPPPPRYQSDKEKIFLSVKDIYTSYYNIKSAEERLEKYRYIAPFAGAFTEVYLEVGSYAAPGAKIARAIRTGSLEIRVPLEPKALPYIKIGHRVRVFSDDHAESTGQIVRISPVINSGTQSVDVFVETHGNYYDGQYLRIEIAGKTIEKGFELARSAVFNQNQVYRVTSDSLLEVVEVQLLKYNPHTLVINGLQEGTWVVDEPLMGAYNRMPVRPVPNIL